MTKFQPQTPDDVTVQNIGIDLPQSRQGESEYDEIQKIALERLGCGYLSKENAMRAELGVTALLITQKQVKMNLCDRHSLGERVSMSRTALELIHSHPMNK